MNTKKINEKEHSKPTEKDFSDPYIIGIGASAGGLDPINALFENLTSLNASYVIIQHLPADFKSNMATLLTKHSKLNIQEVKNNQRIEPDSVYVMTERKSVAIREGIFFITEDNTTLPNNAIDVLFESMAKDKGEKSIAIILSGANEDGTRGAEAIKKAGGYVIVQDPATAQFDVMPKSVIEAGLADAVLAPERMSDEIIKYIEQNALINKLVLNETALMEILELISSNTQLDFTHYKRPTITRRIARRLTHNKINSLEDYIPFLKENHNEINILSKEFMISVTKFFRDSSAFDIIRKTVLPDIIQNKLPNGILKIWVVGCATGEEAYSMAMLVQEYLTEINTRMEVKIFASDIDKDALAIASKGVYPESIVRDISEDRISKFFHHEGNKFRVNEQIRNMLIFAHHDITKHPPYYKLDFISCRNVLIYMDPVLQAKILSTLHFCLNLGGYMFLGPSENIGKLKTKMSETDKKWKVYKNIEKAAKLENGTFSPPKYNLSPKPIPILRSSGNSIPNNVKEIIHEAILQDFGYAGVCVDERFKVVQTFGEYHKYLLPDMFNFNLLEILPKELSIATGVSLRKAIKEDKELKVKGVTFEQKDAMRSVDVLIKPLKDTRFSERMTLVLFNESMLENQKAESFEDFDKENYFKRYTADLEEELKERDEKLDEAYVTLEECYNNAQAYSEELISGNEELQSTNEEVQSINEELQTVNIQYQAK
ncbi:MAG: chemotaxis protein CheB, partial [Cytophagaceae bacterium]